MYRLIAIKAMGRSFFSENKNYGLTWEEVPSLRMPLSSFDDYDKMADIEVVAGNYGLSAKITNSEGQVCGYKTLDKVTASKVLIGEKLDKSRCFICTIRRGDQEKERFHYKPL